MTTDDADATKLDDEAISICHAAYMLVTQKLSSSLLRFSSFPTFKEEDPNLSPMADL